MKKILLSLGTLVVVGGIVAGATIAFYNDTETSTGNIFTAGSIDLKVDHTAQTYNGVDCKTCSVILISDTSNMVVAKNGVPFTTSYPAVYLNPTHVAWTAQNDPALVAAGAKWIWEQNPVKQEDTTVDTTYTFRKEFEWWGPITSSDLSMAVGHDNTVEVWLNGVQIGVGTDIYGFQIEHMLHIPGTAITSNVHQGNNVLEIKLRNRAEPNGNPQNNPAGLIYKFEINGQCGNDWFKTQCRLWGSKDLETEDVFWNLNDIKPADYGSDVISYHVDSNDSWMCAFIQGTDLENDLVEPETDAGDSSTPQGELSGMMDLFAWRDLNGNGVYEPTGETAIYEGVFGPSTILPIAQPTGTPITGNISSYIGMKWCAGNQTVNHTDGTITCNGAGMTDQAQTDSFPATVTLYATQSRNNSDFTCASVQPPR